MALLAGGQQRAAAGAAAQRQPSMAPLAVARCTAAAMPQRQTAAAAGASQIASSSSTGGSPGPRRAAALVARAAAAQAASAAAAQVRGEADVPGMQQYLDRLRWSADGLVPVIVQHVDTGELLMQAYADRAAVCETLQSRLATFYSRSRAERWCKGESSGNFIRVVGVYHDCDRDSLVYLGDPVGPTCHTGARTCWFHEAVLEELPTAAAGGEAAAAATAAAAVIDRGDHHHHAEHAPLTTLLALERTIAARRAAAAAAAAAAAQQQQPAEGAAENKKKPSWTARLLADPALLCKKVREEAGELCQTLEQGEGGERAASEAADLLYHALVLLNLQGVAVEDVLRVLRTRFGTSGVEEKAARPPKQQPPQQQPQA